MSHSNGMSWLKYRRDYPLNFDEAVPDWVCVYDLPVRLRLVRSALLLGWRLPRRVPIQDAFHSGAWSVWGA